MSAILQAIMSCARYPDDLGPDEIVPEETVLVSFCLCQFSWANVLQASHRRWCQL